MNKEATIKIAIPQKEDVFAGKVADSFEEAVDLAIEAVSHQLEKAADRK